MIVGDRYELHDLVGQGGCGMVYRATDRRSGGAVAVKMLTSSANQDPQLVERLVREQQAMQALTGTYAVGAVDLCRASSGALCLVMEWLDGRDMEARLGGLRDAGARMGVSELLGIMRPVMHTLGKAHELGIVHRDIKPANIFLLSEGRGIRLLDFGFSRLKSSATLTAIDTVMGSPSYIAPEAWRGGSKASGKHGDLYAAGVIVFRALSGQVPFAGASLVETMRLVTQAERPSLRALRPDLPPQVDEWVKRGLAVEPSDRFQHASAFTEGLIAVLAGRPLPEHTLPQSRTRQSSVPVASTTKPEQGSALSAAWGRAAGLVKRLAQGITSGAKNLGGLQVSPATSPSDRPGPVDSSPESVRTGFVAATSASPRPSGSSVPAGSDATASGEGGADDTLIATLLDSRPPAIGTPAVIASASPTLGDPGGAAEALCSKSPPSSSPAAPPDRLGDPVGPVPPAKQPGGQATVIATRAKPVPAKPEAISKTVAEEATRKPADPGAAPEVAGERNGPSSTAAAAKLSRSKTKSTAKAAGRGKARAKRRTTTKAVRRNGAADDPNAQSAKAQSATEQVDVKHEVRAAKRVRGRTSKQPKAAGQVATKTKARATPGKASQATSGQTAAKARVTSGKANQATSKGPTQAGTRAKRVVAGKASRTKQAEKGVSPRVAKQPTKQGTRKKANKRTGGTARGAVSSKRPRE